MLLRFAGGEPFATGAAEYSVPASGSAAMRITLQVEIEERPTTAIVDTGSPFMVCHPELAEEIGFNPDEALEVEEILYRNEWVKGGMYRASLVILADEGRSLYVNASVLVPDPKQGFVDDFFPASFLGMKNCLESIRFAVDPSSTTFYFGEHP